MSDAELPGPRRLASFVPATTLSTTTVEPWSVMKFSFMISLVGWVVLFVAVAGGIEVTLKETD